MMDNLIIGFVAGFCFVLLYKTIYDFLMYKKDKENPNVLYDLTAAQNVSKQIEEGFSKLPCCVVVYEVFRRKKKYIQRWFEYYLTFDDENIGNIHFPGYKFENRIQAATHALNKAKTFLEVKGLL